MQKHILLVEDDQDIADLLKLHLTDEGAAVVHCADGVRGLSEALQHKWDLILLDLNLPRCDGLDICQQIREGNPVTPIVIVTARSSEQERIKGLESGADDYITKPFSITELMVRLRALDRRIEAQRLDALAEKNDGAVQSCIISVGDVLLNTDDHSVRISGKLIDLTVKEFELLHQFAKAPGHVFKRAELLEKVWGYSHSGYMHTVNSHINRLRLKVEPEPSKPRYISTVWGVGYKFTA